MKETVAGRPSSAARASVALAARSSAELVEILRTDPSDAGCATTMDQLHIYAELGLADADPQQRYPDIAAHLRACGACATDLETLIHAIRIG